MKWKISKVLFSFSIFIFAILNILSLSIISVADRSYNIEVVDKDYKFLQTIGNENQKFNSYDITIKLINNGAEESDDITLKIWEKQEDVNLSVRRNGTIEAGETMEFTFKDWIVYGTGEHTVMYEYYTTNTSKMSSYNSGSGSFIINDGTIKEENNTPGFELILVLLAFISIFLIKKRRKL
jgi:hypothetical protein